MEKIFTINFLCLFSGPGCARLLYCQTKANTSERVGFWKYTEFAEGSKSVWNQGKANLLPEVFSPRFDH